MKHVATLPPKDREAAIAGVVRVLESFALGKPLNVKIGVARATRSTEQNAYLWSVPYRLLSEATGFEPDDLHTYLLGCHFGWRTRKLPGNRTEQMPIRTTTTDEHGNDDVLDGDEFWRYVEFIQRAGARQGVVIPDPDPALRTKPRRGRWQPAKRAA